MADALITKLSNVNRLIVRPTASVRKYADSQDPIAAGRELGVQVSNTGYGVVDRCDSNWISTGSPAPPMSSCRLPRDLGQHKDFAFRRK
jgi:hypothetical protein